MSAREEGIDARFRGLLGAFSLDVAFGCPMRGVTALFGPSGAGKTTVLRCVAGLLRLSGELKVGGDVWQGRSTFLPPHKRPIGYVFQEPSLFPHLSVRANLLYGHRRALRPGVSGSIRFDDVVELMGIAHLLERFPAGLSGGESQRVAVGRALLSQPRLLLMDEPLAALDRANKAEILPYLEALHQTLSIPVLYVSHDMSDVERLADKLVLLDRGRVLASGPLPDLLADTHLPLARAPEAASIVKATVRALDDRYHLTEMDLDGETLLVPGRIGAPGTSHRIRIVAADVSLATEQPSQTSILNVFSGRVSAIEAMGNGKVNVVIVVGRGRTGSKLLARISRRAEEMLGLSVGQDVYAQVKAVSLIAPGEAPSPAPLKSRP